MASSATRDTGTKRTGSASVKVIADASLECTYLQSVNVGDTNSYTLIAYVYTDGSAVTTADLDLWYNGSEVATTFASDSPAGWYKLSGTLTGANAARDYGVRVHANKTVYLDDFTLTGPAPATITYLLNSGTGGVASLDVESSVTASNFVSDVAVGTSPYATTSTTVNTNLNADLLDGSHVGTTGAVIPLLSTANTWGGAQTFSGGVTFNGGVTFLYAAKTTTYPIVATDSIINCTSGTFTVTLPTAASIAGKMYRIKNSGTGVITIATTSSQTIDGNASGVLTLIQYEALTLASDGANWMIL